MSNEEGLPSPTFMSLVGTCFSCIAPRTWAACSSSRWLNRKLLVMDFLSLSSWSAVLGCTGGVQLSYESATGFNDSADTDVRRAKLYCAG